MNKFAFITHLPNSYRKDLATLHKPLGFIPDFLYKAFMFSFPIKPFVWSHIKVSPISEETDGYVIMLPYTSDHILKYQWDVLPIIEKAIKLAGSLGASTVGLGPILSSVTMRGRLLANNPYAGITNGSTFTAISVYRKVQQLIEEMDFKPKIAIVGATGSVGSLVSTMLAQDGYKCTLISRNIRRLGNLANNIVEEAPSVKPVISLKLQDIQNADMVIMLTCANEFLMHAKYFKKNAIVIDATNPRNISKSLVISRPDIQVVDAGLVTANSLLFSRPDISLPTGITYSSLAETVLLAQHGHKGDFCLGNATLADARYINQIYSKNRRLGFSAAPDFSFGKPLHQELTQSINPTMYHPAIKLA